METLGPHPFPHLKLFSQIPETLDQAFFSAIDAGHLEAVRVSLKLCLVSFYFLVQGIVPG
jgi:hypothetical protein